MRNMTDEDRQPNRPGDDAAMEAYLGNWSYRARLAAIVAVTSLFTVGLPPAIVCWYILEYPLGALFGGVMWPVIVPVFCVITPVCWGFAAGVFAPQIRESLRMPEVTELPFNRMVLLALVMAVLVSIIYLGALDNRSLNFIGEFFLLMIIAVVLGYPFAAIGSGVTFLLIRRFHHYLPLPRDIAPSPRLCPSCEYDLTGNTSGTCPECGTHFN